MNPTKLLHTQILLKNEHKPLVLFLFIDYSLGQLEGKYMKQYILFACIFFVFGSSLNATTVDMFCEQFDTSFSNNLLDLEKMGKAVLKRHNLPTKGKVKVYIRLASLYTCMGKYEEAEKYASMGKSLAKDSSLPKLLARSLSTLSTVYLGLAKQQTNSEQSSLLFKQAKDLGEEALGLARGIKNHTFLLGKVLCKLGSVYLESPYEDSSIAIDLYQEALSYFKEDDIERYKTLNRLAQAQLQTSQLKEAWETLTPLLHLQLEEGVRAFFYITAMKITLKEEGFIQASIFASNALRILKKLHLSANSESIETTIQYIDKKIEENQKNLYTVK